MGRPLSDQRAKSTSFMLKLLLNHITLPGRRSPCTMSLWCSPHTALHTCMRPQPHSFNTNVFTHSLMEEINQSGASWQVREVQPHCPALPCHTAESSVCSSRPYSSVATDSSMTKTKKHTSWSRPGGNGEKMHVRWCQSTDATTRKEV